MAHAIAVEALTKQYKGVTAVSDLSFTAQAGRVVGFLGPNGAGKTTTIRMLLGLVRATAGTATINGQRYVDLPDPLRAVGAVLDGGALHPGRTGRNHMRVLAQTIGAGADRIDELLALVEMTEAADRRAGGYSLGMRQRLGLASALIGDPQILILDEPANGLDPQGIRWLRDFLRNCAAQGRTVLVSSHVLAEISQMADDVVVIDRGRSVVQAPLTDLMARAGGGGVRVAGPDAYRLADRLHAEGAAVTGNPDGSIVVADRTGEHIGRVVAAESLVISELVPLGVSLEDVFLKLTGAGGA